MPCSSPRRPPPSPRRRRRHQTFNPTTQERVILNIDIFHPELTDLECEAIRMTIDLKKKLFGSTEEEEWRG